MCGNKIYVYLCDRKATSESMPRQKCENLKDVITKDEKEHF